MSGQNANLPPGNEEVHPDANKSVWERPALRRLAANEAQGGMHPKNDGKGGGPGSEKQHS
jgi:hypothetical protein